MIRGVLLSPFALGRNEKFLNKIFPKRSMTVLDTLAYIGQLYFLFLLGLELDIRTIRRIGKKVLVITASSVCDTS
ncbi:hypothetical protein CRYUN_Cryun08bG0098900 [Craigia yunnanensis]